MSKKIVLLNPSLFWCKKTSIVKGGLKNIMGTTPPLGLAYIASFLREKHDVVIIDANALRLSVSETKNMIEKISPDMLGVTSFCETGDVVNQIIGDIDVDCLKVVGGADPSTNPGKYHDFFDVVVIGEGEMAFKKMADGVDLKRIKGIHFKAKGKIVKNKGTEFIENLNELEFPAWDLLPVEKYRISLHYIKYKPNFGVVMTSRGCPYDCDYCVSNKVFPNYRKRKPENVFLEMKYLHDTFSIRTIYIWDDTFTADRENAMGLCNLLIKEKMDLRWTCITRADKVDEELLRKMKRAGCFMVLYGVESSCRETLAGIGNRPSIEKIRRAVKLTKKAGMMVKITFIFGLPGDDRKRLGKNVSLAKELNPDIVEFNPLIVLAGSGLERKSFTPEIPKNELNRLVIEAYKEFFFNPKYLLSRIKYLWNPAYLYRYLKCMFYAF